MKLRGSGCGWWSRILIPTNLMIPETSLLMPRKQVVLLFLCPLSLALLQLRAKYFLKENQLCSTYVMDVFTNALIWYRTGRKKYCNRHDSNPWLLNYNDCALPLCHIHRQEHKIRFKQSGSFWTNKNNSSHLENTPAYRINSTRGSSRKFLHEWYLP